MTEHSADATKSGDFEQERRFVVGETEIVVGEAWTMIEQAYLWSGGGYAVRVRIESDPNEKTGKQTNHRATWAAKGPRIGDERREYEREFPLDLAHAIVEKCEHVISKKRYKFVDEHGHAWDIDEFFGQNRGLMIAELEAGRNKYGVVEPNVRDALRAMKPPSWSYREVTSDRRFNNEELALIPVTQWSNRQDWRDDSVWNFDK